MDVGTLLPAAGLLIGKQRRGTNAAMAHHRCRHNKSSLQFASHRFVATESFSPIGPSQGKRSATEPQETKVSPIQSQT